MRSSRRSIAELCGGADELIRRASRPSPTTTCGWRATSPTSPAGRRPTTPSIHAARAEIYIERRKAEPSLMSKGIFMAAARESQAVAEASTT